MYENLICVIVFVLGRFILCIKLEVFWGNGSEVVFLPSHFSPPTVTLRLNERCRCITRNRKTDVCIGLPKYDGGTVHRK